ncbi:MAG: hypothetical protein ABIT01_17905 [Thermoanaerobaculia bacterium]
MSRLDVRAGLLFLLTGLALPAAAGTRAPGFESPRSQAAVRGNTSVHVEWTLPGDLDSEEMELVLSLDAGKTFPVRVTREIESTARGVAWRVPNLPTRQARLGLRAEVDDEEVLLFVSPEFVIEQDQAPHLEEVVEIGGELRTRDAVEGRLPTTLPGGGLQPAHERISASVFEQALDKSGAFVLPSPSLLPGPLLGESTAFLAPPPAARAGARISLPKRE